VNRGASARRVRRRADLRARFRALDGEIWAARNRRALRDVEAFVMFVGYPRTGHTLICAALDAHPEIVLANELDALAYVKRGVSRRSLYGMVLARDRRWVDDGCRWEGYDYRIPGQSQGSWTRLRVIGDKTAGHSSMRLGIEPNLFERLRRTVDVPLKVLHVTRHPLDTVARMAKVNGLQPIEVLPEYLRFAKTAASLRTRVDPDDWIDARHEDLLAEPAAGFARLCTFLGVDASPSYLDACAALVRPRPNESRRVVEWDPEVLGRLAKGVAGLPVLGDYDILDAAR